MVLDLIQGLSLLHYDSKQIAGHQQRIDVSRLANHKQTKNIYVPILGAFNFFGQQG